MRLRHCCLALATLLIPSAPAEPQANPQQAPEVIRAPQSTPSLLWISAAAVAKGKQVGPDDLLRQRSPLGQALELQRPAGKAGELGPLVLEDRSTQPCKPKVFLSDLASDNCPAGNLGDLFDYSHSIFEARIEAAEPGFFRELPSSLLVLRVRQWFRQPAGSGMPEYLYIHSPAAHFELGKVQFCGTSTKRIYQAGDSVLVFLDSSAFDDEGLFFVPREVHVMLMTGEKEILFPEELKLPSPKAPNLQELERLLRVHPMKRDRSNCLDGGEAMR